MKSKDEGGRRKAEGMADDGSAFLSSFILHPSALLFCCGAK
jgi:hypothetical protein